MQGARREGRPGKGATDKGNVKRKAPVPPLHEKRRKGPSLCMREEERVRLPREKKKKKKVRNNDGEAEFRNLEPSKPCPRALALGGM